MQGDWFLAALSLVLSLCHLYANVLYDQFCYAERQLLLIFTGADPGFPKGGAKVYSEVGQEIKHNLTRGARGMHHRKILKI